MFTILLKYVSDARASLIPKMQFLREKYINWYDAGDKCFSENNVLAVEGGHIMQSTEWMRVSSKQYKLSFDTQAIQ